MATSHPPSFCPTLITPGLLGADRAQAAWQRVQRDYLRNALPLELRVGLLCAAWEQPTGPSAIHATGMSLLGHEEHPVDLAAIWGAMLDDDAARRLAMVTRHVVLGRSVPAQEMQRVIETLGRWHHAWQDLVAYAVWADTLYRTHMPFVAPLDDERLELWLTQLAGAGAAAGPLVRPLFGQT